MTFSVRLGLLSAVVGATFGFGNPVAQAATCTLVDGGSCSYQYTSVGTSGATVPFGSVTATEAANGSTITFAVDVSPNFSLTAGSSHEAFAFAIGTNTTGALANLGSITSITQNGGNGTLSADAGNGTAFANSPFGDFNYAIDCAPNGGSTNCGQKFTVVFTFTTPNGGKLVASTGDSTIWFASDICVPNTSGGCASTGVAGASVVAVPGPIVGAGLPGLVMACGGLLALARRRRQKIA
jgi:hypothetical protein